MKEEIIELFKAKAEMRELEKGIKTEEDLVDYFFGEKVQDINLRESESKDRLKGKILKNKNSIVKAVTGALAVVILSGCIFAGCKAMVRKVQNEPEYTQKPPTTTTTTILDNNDYGHQLSQEEVLQIAEKALAKVEEEMVSKGVRPMGDPSGPYFPEWFNAEMLATIVLLESSNRVTEEDGSPLYGKPVKINGTTQRARGMCQILPDTLDYVNWWLKNIIKSEMSFTMEDCDNPETALMICIMINIANGNNNFSHWKPIYEDLDFKNNPHLQRDCVIASYHNGPECVINAYNAGVLMNTYLNRNTSEGEYLKRFYNNKIECDRQR